MHYFTHELTSLPHTQICTTVLRMNFRNYFAREFKFKTRGPAQPICVIASLN